MSTLFSSLTLLAMIQPVPAEDWSPTPEQSAVYKALSIRDPAPSCAEVEALAADPLDALRTVVERATMPPWAPMRAAHCIATRHATEARADLLSWVGSEDTRGLGLVVLDSMSTMDEPLALELAGAALAGPLAEDAKTRLVEHDSAALRALVDQPM